MKKISVKRSQLFPGAALILALSFGVVAPSAYAQSGGIQMLPPLEGIAPPSETIPCKTNEGSKVLTWDGQTAIGCSPGFVINAAGQVGIGMTNPSTPLEVNGYVTIDNGQINMHGWSVLGADSTTAYLRGANIAFQSNAAAGIPSDVTYMYINNNGFVGINTTQPTNFLTIADGASSVNLGVAGTCGIMGMTFTSSNVCGAAPALMVDQNNNMIFNVPSSSSYSFRINNNPFPDALHINPSGNVGIWATEPVATLDIGNYGYMHIGGNCYPSNLTSQGAYISWNVMSCGGGETDFINNQGLGAGGFAFILANQQGVMTNNAMFINGLGNVGIGNTNPSYKLDVNGQARFTGNYTTSDRRLKTNIVDISYGLDTVMKLHPVFFDWKKPVQGEDGRRVGFIAQEVEEVIPEVVTTAPDEMKTKAVEYGNVTPVLVKAIQQIKTLFDTDHDALARLKADNDSLRAEFEAYRKAHP